MSHLLKSHQHKAAIIWRPLIMSSVGILSPARAWYVHWNRRGSLSRHQAKLWTEWAVQSRVTPINHKVYVCCWTLAGLRERTAALQGSQDDKSWAWTCHPAGVQLGATCHAAYSPLAATWCWCGGMVPMVAYMAAV